MVIKSMFRDPTLPLDVNVHHYTLARPDQKEWPDFTLFIDATTGRKHTFRQFTDRVYDGATALGTPKDEGGLGLSAESGEIVGILSENCVDYIALVHSLLAITTPFSLLPNNATRFELTHAMKLSKITRLFVHPNMLSKALPVAKELGLKDQHIYTMGGSAYGRRSFSDFVRMARTKKMKRIAVRPAKRDTLAYLVFSSGTSGLPKGVMISHGNISCATAQYVIVVEEILKVWTPATVKTLEGLNTALQFLPLYHTYGLHNVCFRATLAPSTHVILAKWQVETALRLIAKYRVTNMSLIPSVAHQLANSPHTKKYDLSSLISVSSGAAYLPPDLSEKLSGLLPRKLAIGEGYGMSETTIAALALPKPGMLEGRANPARGATGILLPGMEARIVRDDGSEAAVKEPGELYLRGPNIALGYWNNEKSTKEAFGEDGWLRTGDRFYADENGLFFFADRVKDTLKVSGMQVSPVEIEDVLLAHPEKLIIDATVAGVSGFGRTEDEKIPHAWVVLSAAGKKKGVQETVKVLLTWTEENLSKYKHLRGGIEVVREIPKLPTGKVLRRVLVDRYEQKHKTKAKL